MKSHQLENLAAYFFHNPPKTHPCPIRIRALLDGQYVFSTLKALYVWEHSSFPQYYVPASNLKLGHKKSLESLGIKGAYTASLQPGESARPLSTVDVLGWEESYNAPDGGDASGLPQEDGASKKSALAGMIKIPFAAMDKWFEEDGEIVGHPRDPFKRITTAPSSREVVVSIEGEEVARSSDNVFLYETLLPSRYYMSKTSVNWPLLRESRTISLCPYKGEARYYDVHLPSGKVHRDAVWHYPYPTPESIAIQGRVCFYNEKVDVDIDGVREKRPRSKFG